MRAYTLALLSRLSVLTDPADGKTTETDIVVWVNEKVQLTVKTDLLYSQVKSDLQA